MASKTRASSAKRPSEPASRGKKRSRGAAKRARSQVYFFGGGRAAGRAAMRNLLGGKGANLAEMTRLSVPVPAGFTLSTEVCGGFNRQRGRLSKDLKQDVLANLRRVEKVMGGRFGDRKAPLLVSVRSGARVSMPGMMDTVLNLGLTDATVEGLAEHSGDARFAFDSYRRFVQMYGNVVLEIPLGEFEAKLAAAKQARGVKHDTGLESEDLKALVKTYKRLVKARTGKPFPESAEDQLWGAIGAVFRSWNTPRAVTYRKLYDIPHEWGTAVNVQAMVFGNLGDDSATGVAFTRDPSTGDKLFYGEYLPKAQGEDVVAGIRTPHPISKAGRKKGDPPSLEEAMPKCYGQLLRVARLLERHYRDMQDLEFTIQHGTLWMLQTRSGKRTARAAVKVAVDLVRERLIDRKTAILRVEPDRLEELLHPTLDRAAAPPPIGRGLPASPGAASGQVVFTADAAEKCANQGLDVILVRPETSPEDIHGMHAAQGILTSLGGMTSHAAVVARGMGKCCITGCSDLLVDAERGSAKLGSVEFSEGDVITLDGSSGFVFKGRVPTVEPELSREFQTLMGWADSARRMQVRANADNPADAALARTFGAQGIGLCRTEHMFFQPERILAVRRMILAQNSDERAAALHQILPMQRDDFFGILRAMAGLPVTIRLLDPPLHEFLPHTDEEVAALATDLGLPPHKLWRKIEALREFNPMLGQRGCRLGVIYPEIYEVQARAIIEAACACAAEGIQAKPEIMIPLITDVEELRLLRQLIEATARAVMQERRRRIRFSIGTMIEVPRAALTAGKVAEVADFFSFGTNDLTQTTLALSRDDAGRFIPTYVSKGILPHDPFVTLDQEGVGELIRIGVRAGRKTRPDLKLGLCGEHGGDPRSIQFCDAVGLDYVSCSPYRVPIARLAAARVTIEAGSTG